MADSEFKTSQPLSKRNQVRAPREGLGAGTLTGSLPSLRRTEAEPGSRRGSLRGRCTQGLLANPVSSDPHAADFMCVRNETFFTRTDMNMYEAQHGTTQDHCSVHTQTEIPLHLSLRTRRNAEAWPSPAPGELNWSTWSSLFWQGGCYFNLDPHSEQPFPESLQLLVPLHGLTSLQIPHHLLPPSSWTSI